MLVVKGLHSFYGNIEALHGVEIEVKEIGRASCRERVLRLV